MGGPAVADCERHDKNVMARPVYSGERCQK